MSKSSLRLFPILILLFLAAPLAAQGEDYFVDRAADLGLVFEHWNARTGALYFPEMTGQGAALFDADGDGDLDAYLVQGALLREEDRGKTLEEPPESAPRDRLFRNDLSRDAKGRAGEPRFVDVTATSGLAATGYGMGVATGDIDNDGDIDLYVANYGANQLWRNRGDGTFEDRTAEAGVAGPAGNGTGWSVGATFADLDRDGFLDLYVLDYVHFDVGENPRCFANSSRRDYCGPSSFKPAVNHYYRNRGDGTFEERTTQAGFAGHDGASLGVVAADFDGNGWLDLYVANDGQENNLWLGGVKPGTFTDDAMLAGVAFNREGQPEASMGIAAGDADNDGDLDLFLTHLMGETNTYYVNQGGGLFDDRSIESGLAAPSLAATSFGTAFVDVDNDGWLDLVVISGAVRILEERVQAGDSYPLGQADQLFMNRGGRFVDATARAGGAFAELAVGRGLAVGDVDDDGDADLLVTNNLGAARLLINRRGQEHPWLGLRLRHPEADGGGPALGATVTAHRRGGKSFLRRAASDGSYASASDPRVLIGLGDQAGDLTELVVRWPGGEVESFAPPPAGAYHDLVRGTGKKPAATDTAGQDDDQQQGSPK